MKNKIIIPFPVDIHVHFRDPGETYKEDFSSGTKAAIAGGITTVLDMPNNKIPILSKNALKSKIISAENRIFCDMGFYFGSTGNNLGEFDHIKDQCAGLKIYLSETTGHFILDSGKIKRVFSEWGDRKPIVIHLQSTDMLDMIIEEAINEKVRIHITHISKREILERIISAKKEGVNITCDATPHHLVLDRSYHEKYGSLGLVKPELADKMDLEYLWENIELVDCFASDHAPHTREEKSGTKLYGFPGVQTMIPIIFTEAKKRNIPPEKIVERFSSAPSRIFNIRTDSDTYTVINTGKEYEMTNDLLQSKSGWSPYEGMILTTSVEKTVLRGETVYENGKIIGEAKGKLVQYIR